MLKELPRSPPSPTWRSEATSIVPDQDAATRTSPLCYVVDDEPGIRNMISYALQGDGIATREFESAAALLDAVAECAPDLIFLDLSLDGSDAVDAIRGLDLLGYSGTVQLISGRDEALLNDIKSIGQRRSLRMLPVLAPFRLDAIRQVVMDLIAGQLRSQSLASTSDQAALLDVDPGARSPAVSRFPSLEALANDGWSSGTNRSSTSRGNAWRPRNAGPVRHPKYGISAHRRSCRARTWARCARSPSGRSFTAAGLAGICRNRHPVEARDQRSGDRVDDAWRSPRSCASIAGRS